MRPDDPLGPRSMPVRPPDRLYANVLVLEVYGVKDLLYLIMCAQSA
jgi:hypothetical protein